MNRDCSPSPKSSQKTNDTSSVDSYEEAFSDIEDGDIEFTHIHTPGNFEESVQCNNNESRPSSVNRTDWEEPESWVASMANSESFPVSTPGSSSGASPLTGTSSQGISPGVNNEQAFPFSIPEDPDQSLSSISDVLQVEKDFMEYVMSFPLNVPSVPPQLLPATAPSTKKAQNESNPKVGLDHLDNLCKLMEQLSDLKEANIKLRRRVQYLEDIKTLHEIHKEMVGERKIYSSGLSEDEVQQLKQKFEDSQEREPSEDSHADSQCIESPSQDRLLGLYRSKTTNQIPPVNEYKCERGHKSRSATINKDRRERSKSVGHPGHSKTKKRPSRWSKVKEVLGIEKTDELSTGGEAEKSDERNIATPPDEIPQKCQGRINRKESEHSKFHAQPSRSHSNVLSSRSFSEAERQTISTTPVKKSGTLDSKTAQAAMERFEKEEMSAKKSPKTPWGKMKTMIQIRRDNRNPKSESSSSSPRDAKPNKSTGGQTDLHNGHANSRKNQRSNHRSSYQEGASGVEAADYEGLIQGNQFSERNLRHQRMDNGCLEQYRHLQKSPQKHGYRKASLSHLENSEISWEENTSAKNREEVENICVTKDSKENGKRKKSKPRPLPLEYVNEQQCSYPAAEEDEREVHLSISPASQRKCMWMKVKDVLKGKREDDGPLSLSAPSSPGSITECMGFDFDVEKTKEDDNQCQTSLISDNAPNSMMLSSASPTTTVTELLRELQQNLSDDFNKKLEEWQRCRAEGIHKASGSEVERKDSFGRLRKISKPEKKISTNEKLPKTSYHVIKKDLSWLEKEQQKVEREIIRLSKEKQKFEKRSFRLKQLKEAMMDGDGQKKEVLVKTSAGEFRFEGISDAFTKKLYEWETKKGVNPELSTIALLDESLKPPVETIVSPPCSSSVGSNSARPSPEPPKNCYQVSRASSEPDLSTTQKETGSNNQATSPLSSRSKSGDTLLAGDKEMVTNLEIEATADQGGSREVMQHADDNYYSLLEENMYLLDQLKEKEEICSHLQNELDRLDDKTEKTNRTHQEEMEKYRQKLWEIHMSRPRDLQGSLHLISELKSRIEELQKCSDKLKLDRERLEESFRFHSNQQAKLADDLIRKVRELQESGIPLGYRSGYRRKWRKTVKCDPSSIAKIHDLSTTLLQQARDVEQTLMERTRQVCHLRWELLHRDMSAVLLQAALHRVTSQGEPVTILPTWDKRRNKFKNIKAWSVDTTTRRPSEDLVTDDWLQERLRQLSMTPYNDWVNIDFSPNDLMATAHELKKETLRLSIPRSDRVSDSEEKKSATCSAESEIADSDRYYDTGSAVNSRSSSFSSGPGGLRGSHSDTRLYERTRALRRNSSSSMSCVEASDSSSIHDSDKMHFLVKRFPWRTQWRSLDNVSSSCSSRSSVMDDDLHKSHWRPIKIANKVEIGSQEDAQYSSHLQQKYGSFKEVEEESEEAKSGPCSDWGNQCLITPKPIHLARISDNESDKNSPSSLFCSSRLRSSEHEMTRFSPAKCVPGGYATAFNFPRDCRGNCEMCIGQDSFEHQNISYKNTTDGSMESLDKYETAIRDEELTTIDEQNKFQLFDFTRGKGLETFSDFEENLRQRVTKQPQANSSQSSSSHHNSISDYIDKDKRVGCSSAAEGSNISAPNSPNITKFKYKGTKGFGRSPRLGYGKHDDDDDKLTFRSPQSFNNRTSKETS